MVPPTFDGALMYGVSLPGWKVKWAFETAKECDLTLSQIRQSERHPGQMIDWELYTSQCIASDDPRLTSSTATLDPRTLKFSN